VSEPPGDRVQDLFDRAVLLPAEQRAAFLETACAGNPALRAEVESLLACDLDFTECAGDLLDAARSLNQWQEVKPEQKRLKTPAKREGLSRPGDDFNARGKWADILTPHGWTFAGE
jgi:hypothetical protein